MKGWSQLFLPRLFGNKQQKSTPVKEVVSLRVEGRPGLETGKSQDSFGRKPPKLETEAQKWSSGRNGKSSAAEVTLILLKIDFLGRKHLLGRSQVT